ncbi:hypothetical protein ACUR5C_13750 [Aliikangiella sp. IMCC44653]
MNHKTVIFLAFITLFICCAWLIKNDAKPISEKELANLSQVMQQAFSQKNTPQSKPSNSAASQSILAIIYLKADATWFFKATGSTQLVDENSATFAELFLYKLNFDTTGEPNFSHVPAEYKSQSNSNMRFASFNINGLDISVSQLSANQNIDDNIARWRDQLSLRPSDPQFVKYQNNNQTVLVRLDQPSQAPVAQSTQAPQAPAKEDLNSFADVKLSEHWKIIPASGMASAAFEFNNAQQSAQVAVLRLPSNVALQTVLNIWKGRMGISEQKALSETTYTNQAKQQWQLITLANDADEILVAIHSGSDKRTFFRLSNGKKLTPLLVKEFKALLEGTQLK